MYARLQKAGEEAIAHATAIRVDALTLMGEMLKGAEKDVGGRPPETGSRVEPVSKPPTLAESGISRKESMYAQALADVKEKSPEVYEKVRAGKATVALFLGGK